MLHSICVSILGTKVDSVSYVFIPLVHTNENGAVVHLDNTLSYSIEYNSTDNK